MKRDGILACFVWALLSALATVLTGCGGGGGGGAGGDPGSTTFFPLAVGNHWAFGNNESVARSKLKCNTAMKSTG